MTGECPYDPSAGPEEAAAAATWWARQHRLNRGWRANGWHDPEAKLRQLDAQRFDPEERRSRAYKAQRSQAPQNISERDAALRWLAQHATIAHEGPS